MRNKRKMILMFIPFILMVIATYFIYIKGLEHYNDYRYKSAKNVKALFKPIYDYVACSSNDCDGFLAIKQDEKNLEVTIMDEKANIINHFIKEKPFNKEINLIANYKDFYILKETEANCQKYCDTYEIYKKKDLKLSLQNLEVYNENLLLKRADNNYELYDKSLKKIKDISLNSQIINDNHHLFIIEDKDIITSKGKRLEDLTYVETIKDNDKIKYLIAKEDDKYLAISKDGVVTKTFDSYFVDKYNNNLIVKVKDTYYQLNNNNFIPQDIKADYYNELFTKTSFTSDDAIKASIYNENQNAHLILKEGKVYIYHHKTKDTTLLNESMDNVSIKKLDNNMNKNVILLINFKDNEASLVYDFTDDKEIFKHLKKKEMIKDIIIQGNYISVASFSKMSPDIYRYYLYQDNKPIEKSINGLIGLYNMSIDYGTRNDFIKYFDPLKGFILNNDRSNIFRVESQDKLIEVIDNKDAVIILNDKLKYKRIDKSLVNINNIGINFKDLKAYYNFFDNSLYEIKLRKNEKQKGPDGNVLYPYRNAFFINNFKEKEAKIVSKKETNVIYKSSGEILDVYKKENGKILVYFNTLNNKKTILEIN